MLRYIHNLATTGYWFEKALKQSIIEWKATLGAENLRVLDFGCGTKPFKKLFHDVNCEYIGLDVYEGSSVDVVYDGDAIPLEDRSVDLVHSVSVFEHVEMLDTSLQEIARVLKPGGTLIGIVPFMNHVHGVPYDYHRPTRLGWEQKLKNAFGEGAKITVAPVDSRIACLGNLLTAQINFLFFDIAHWIKSGGARGELDPKGIQDGGASPESASTALRIFYFLLKLNPINFLIGLLCWMLHRIPIQRRLEGEITSGYCCVVKI